MVSRGWRTARVLGMMLGCGVIGTLMTAWAPMFFLGKPSRPPDRCSRAWPATDVRGQVLDFSFGSWRPVTWQWAASGHGVFLPGGGPNGEDVLSTGRLRIPMSKSALAAGPPKWYEQYTRDLPDQGEVHRWSSGWPMRSLEGFDLFLSGGPDTDTHWIWHVPRLSRRFYTRGGMGYLPLRPIPLGTAIDVAFWSGPVLCLCGVRGFLRWRRRQRGLCAFCGYPRSGVEGGGICPECGGLCPS
jgi:hypothetical protein